MSKSIFNHLSTTIDTLIAFGTPDVLNVTKFDVFQAKVGAEALAKSWQHTLGQQGVYTLAQAETMLGAKACAIATRYGFIRGERVDRTGVQHTPECKIMWMLDRQDENKPGAKRAALRNEYGWLRQTMIGVLEQVKIVYGVEIMTSDGRVMIDVLRDALVEAKAYWFFNGSYKTVDGYAFREGIISDEQRKYMARAKAALARIVAEVDRITPVGELCSCGRTHGEVVSTVEAPAEAVDMSAPDESEAPMSVVQTKLLRDAENLIADLTAELMDDNGKVPMGTLRKRLQAKRSQTNLNAAIQYILNRGTVANF